MQTQDAIRKRHSIRFFNNKPVDRNLIEHLVDLARLAPTARNVQPWEFVAVTHKNTLKELGALADNGKFIAESACCIAVLCSDTKYYLEDGCAATENILLGASDLGLSACWVAGDKKPYADEILKLLKAPAGYKLVSLLPIGYSDAVVHPPTKRSLKDLLHWEKF
jgi:nitroreductase